MRQRDQPGPRSHHGFERTQIDPAVFGQRADIDLRAGPFGDHLPRDDVRVMLQHRQDDAIALADLRHAPARRDQIDRFGRTADEDHLVLALRADEFGNAATRGFIAKRHLRATSVHASVDSGVIHPECAGHRIDDGLRFLRGGGCVQVMPRRAIAGYHAGEIGTDIGGRRKGGSDAHSALSTLSSAICIKVSRVSSSSRATRASPRNACTIKRRASSGETPRAAM